MEEQYNVNELKDWPYRRSSTRDGENREQKHSNRCRSNLGLREKDKSSWGRPRNEQHPRFGKVWRAPPYGAFLHKEFLASIDFCFQEDLSRLWYKMWFFSYDLGSLTLISVVVVGFMRFIKEPIRSVIHGTTDTVRSSLFLATLVATYQAVICTQRKLVCRAPL